MNGGMVRGLGLVGVLTAATWLTTYGGEIPHATFEQFMRERGYQRVQLKYSGNRLQVIGKLNGTRVYCGIDTGSRDVLVDVRKATKLKSLGKEQLNHDLPLGKITTKAQPVLIDRLELGQVVISNQPAISFDLHMDRQVHTGSMLAESRTSWEVLLGMNFLEPVHAVLDCKEPALYIRAEPPGKEIVDNIEASLKLSGFVPVPILELKEPALFTRAEVNGHPAIFCVDSGGPFTACDQQEFKHFELKDRGKVGKMTDLSSYHRSDLREARIAEMRFGDFELKDVPVTVAELAIVQKANATLKSSDGTRILGLLGPEILYRGQAFIDCSRHKMYFRAAAFK